MSRLRRLATLTCAGLAPFALAGSATLAPATATVPQSTPTSSPVATAAEALASPTGRAVVRFADVPSRAQLRALRGLGLTVRGLDALPMAVVHGPAATLARIVPEGLGLDVRPDEVLAYADTASSDVMSSSPAAAKKLRSRGLTGKGVTVGVIDSGCDGTHPDLADHIVHNVILLSPEYANAGTSPVLPIPMGDTPYSNTDLGSGHGTHVAGIVAADGTSSPDHLGVAPDAELACFAIGAVITTTAVVTAYDYILDQPDLLGIDVINNSWGNSFRQYDPEDPVNVATKAVSDRGVTVVFSAGNSGSGDAEASVSPFNQAPWVISVAAGDLSRQRGSFSSNGLELDNGRAVAIGADGHTVHRGDRIGLTQPDIMAPGVSISSSCDSTGTVIGPCPDHGNTSASGTSMSAPHIAGAAAVLLQANPRLTPAQVQLAMKATASPVRTPDGTTLGSHQVGYGHVNLDRAVTLVKGRSGKALKKRIARAMRKADRRLARQDDWKVARTDQWQSDALPVAVDPLPFFDTHELRVAKSTDAVKLAVVYPTPGTAANLAEVTATLVAADGTEVGSTSTDLLFSHGTGSVLLEDVAPGDYTLELGGYYVSDPDTLDSDSINGRVVFVSASQLKRR